MQVTAWKGERKSGDKPSGFQAVEVPWCAFFLISINHLKKKQQNQRNFRADIEAWPMLLNGSRT